MNRWAYHSSAIGGWSALAGWLVGELLLLRGAAPEAWQAFLLGLLAGPVLGAGLSVAASLGNAWWTEKARRFGPGLVGPAVAGALGGPVLVPFLGVAALPAGMFARACAFVAVGLVLGAALALLQLVLAAAPAAAPKVADEGRPARKRDAPSAAPTTPSPPLPRPTMSPSVTQAASARAAARPRPPAPATMRAPLAPAGPPLPDACPRCQRRCPGAAGQRYCMVCEVKF